MVPSSAHQRNDRRTFVDCNTVWFIQSFSLRSDRQVDILCDILCAHLHQLVLMELGQHQYTTTNKKQLGNGKMWSLPLIRQLMVVVWQRAKEKIAQKRRVMRRIIDFVDCHWFGCRFFSIFVPLLLLFLFEWYFYLLSFCCHTIIMHERFYQNISTTATAIPLLTVFKWTKRHQKGKKLNGQKWQQSMAIK